jgi:hypothetical protein
MTERCYYDYLRVYVPSGAELLQATPHAVPGSILLSGEQQPAEVDVSRGEEGKTVFATFLVLRPGESLETSFSYTLPRAIAEGGEGPWRYSLIVQKQPGTDARPLELAIDLPADAKILEAHPEPAERRGSVLQYRLDLRTDVSLELSWE